jgi:hypothetical protein
LFASWAFPSGVVAAGVAVVYAAFEAGVADAIDGLFAFIAGLTERVMLLHEGQLQDYYALNSSRR